MGMKSRGVYETPGGTILLTARRALESICLDRGESHLKDELMPRQGPILLRGFSMHAADAPGSKLAGQDRPLLQVAQIRLGRAAGLRSQEQSGADMIIGQSCVPGEHAE